MKLKIMVVFIGLTKLVFLTLVNLLLKMNFIMENNNNLIGYSNGVAYHLKDYDLINNTGLCEVDGWIGFYWCKFDFIINEKT
jgi:hypothetical protein